MRKNIYDLKLHEWTNIDEDDGPLPYNTVLRVPGGWIYCQWNNGVQNYEGLALFVPFKNEFMSDEQKESYLPKLVDVPEPIKRERTGGLLGG